MAPLVRLERLTKSFEEGGQSRIVLRELSAQFEAGQITSVRGRSGSGKSTLLNLIAGLDEPDSGEISVAGHLVSRMTPRERAIFRRQHIGFVFQFFNLIPTLTVLENVRLPSELAGESALEADRLAHGLLAEVGLTERAGEFPDRLSGGEQQRVAIARALIEAPVLVLADEPTGNLDRAAGEAVLALMRRLMGERGAAVILATHSHRIARLADNCLAMEDGRLVPDTGVLE
jgi:putative ABC transport system ATP-binding protein